MKENARPSARAYPQTGVASTCRSYREYLDMFGLTEERVRHGPVLDAAAGASSFVAGLRASGVTAVAADPLYAGDPEAVIAAAWREHEEAERKIESLADSFDWSYYGSPARHRAMREASLRAFADDFRSPDRASRYIPASLPNLPFADGTFGLAVCSHFLFLYGESFGYEFHLAALRELLRVVRPGGQVYVYPLVDLKWQPCPFLPELLNELAGLAEAETVPTRLPFVPADGSVLRLTRRKMN